MIGLLQKYHNTLGCPSKILHKHCVQLLSGRNWKQYLCKRLQQKVLWYFFKRPILTFKSLYKNPRSNHSNLFSSSFAHYLFMYFTKRNLVCFSRLANGGNAGAIHNYCENNAILFCIVHRRLENNAKLLSRAICILRTIPHYVLHSAKYPCRLIKVTKRAVLSPFKVSSYHSKVLSFGHLFSPGGSLIETRYMVST